VALFNSAAHKLGFDPLLAENWYKHTRMELEQAEKVFLSPSFSLSPLSHSKN
jgi:hypothetical protein